MELRHQEATSDSRTGEAYYFHHRFSGGSDSLRVVESAREGRYFVQVWRTTGWTNVINDVESDRPEGAANVALDVIGHLR